MAALAEEEADAAEFLAAEPASEMPEDAFVPPGAEFAWVAFWRLHQDRPQITTSFVMPGGLSAVAIVEPRPGRIPFAAIDCYARRYEIEGSTFDLLLALVDRIDSEYLKWEAGRARDRRDQAQQAASSHG